MTIAIPSVWHPSRERWESPDGKYYFDPVSAEYAESFYPTCLQHHIGEFDGLPFELMDYQKYLIVRPLFGWKRATDGLRRFRKVFLAVPKGSGKSPMGAGTGLLLAFFDGEAGAEVFAVAADRKQAGIVHDSAKVMVERNPDLEARCEVFRDSIKLKGSTEAFQVISADASTKHGFRPHGIIFDEFHAQPDRELFDTLYRGMGKRRQPVLMMITTAGDDDESICVGPDTRLLTTDLRWVRAGDVAVGDELAGFDESRPFPKHRMWRKSAVIRARAAVLPSYRLTFDDGTVLTCSAEHNWLIQTAGRRVQWKATKDITPTDEFFRVATPWEELQSRDAGYLAGLLDSEGHLSLAKNSFLLCGFSQRRNVVADEGRRILRLLGFRFGVYDTTGTKNHEPCEQTMVLRKHEIMRLLGQIRPQRLLDKFVANAYGNLRCKSHAHPKLVEKTFIGPSEVIGLKTTTRTFVAEGLASHNCFEEWDYARRLIGGSVDDDTYLPIIFELKPDEDWSDQENLKRVNPGYGITVKADYFEAEVAAAKAEPRKRNSFLQLHGNRWVNQATAWIPVEWWDACNDTMPTLEELAALPCAGGLDLAQKYDLACLAVTFRQPLKKKELEQLGPEGVEVLHETDTGAIVKKTIELNYRLIVVPFFWIPEDTMREREKDDRIPYSIWARETVFGVPLVQPTEGAIIDYTRIFTDARDIIATRFPRLKEGGLGYDPAFATDLATKLRDLAGFKVNEVLQNYTHLSEPSQIFEALVKAGRVVHGGHRTLRNHVENVTIRSDDAGRIRPVKPKRRAGSKRIDGVIASIMGVKQLETVPDVPFDKFQMFVLGGKK